MFDILAYKGKNTGACCVFKTDLLHKTSIFV